MPSRLLQAVESNFGHIRAFRGVLRKPRLPILLIGLSLAVIAFPLATSSLLVPASFVYPIMAPKKTSNYGFRIHPIRRFGHNHSGIDLAAPEGTPIRAVAAGTVIFAGRYKGYGNLISIQHAKRLTSHYAHCNTLKTKIGQRVKAGQIIGSVGSSGMSTGPHLHFEIRIDGEPRNPESFIPGLASEALG